MNFGYQNPVQIQYEATSDPWDYLKVEFMRHPHEIIVYVLSM